MRSRLKNHTNPLFEDIGFEWQLINFVMINVFVRYQIKGEYFYIIFFITRDHKKVLGIQKNMKSFLKISLLI